MLDKRGLYMRMVNCPYHVCGGLIRLAYARQAIVCSLPKSRRAMMFVCALKKLAVISRIVPPFNRPSIVVVLRYIGGRGRPFKVYGAHKHVISVTWRNLVHWQHIRTEHSCLILSGGDILTGSECIALRRGGQLLVKA